MIQKLIKNWWLLALCGVLAATISVIYLIRQDTDGPLTFHAWHRTIVFLGKLTLATGIFTIVAGIWSFGKGKSRLLVLNGLACSALGAIFAFWTGPLAFRTVALLIVVMAMSIGIYELAIARTCIASRMNGFLARPGWPPLVLLLHFLLSYFDGSDWSQDRPPSPCIG